jgi:hypothetical protein
VISKPVYQSSFHSANDATTYNFTSKGIGSAAANRWVIIGIASRAATANSVTAVTIGGITAAKLSEYISQNSGVAFWTANVPTGTTANVDITFEAGMSRVGVVLWTVNHTKMPSVASSTTFNNTVLTNTLTVNAGEVGVGLVYLHDATAWTWTGLTKDVDYDIIEIGSEMSAASEAFTGAKTAYTIDPYATGGWSWRAGLALSLK